MSRLLLLCVCASFVGASYADAQAARTRGGAWATLGFSYGSAHFFCDTCSTQRHSDGMDVLLALGGMLNPRWRVAANLEIWEHWFPGRDTLKETTTGGVSAYYYPFVRAGLFFEGGLGLSDYRMLKGLHEGILFENADRTFFKGLGWGATGGVGYDLKLGHHSLITTRLAYRYGGIGTLRTPFGTAVARRWKQNVFSLGLEYDWTEGP